MKTLIQRSALIVSLAVFTACGGSDDGSTSGSTAGGSADNGPTVAELKAEVPNMETAEIESSRDDTQEQIASVEQQIEDLIEKIKEQGGDAIGGAVDSLMGEGTADQAKADAAEVLDQLKAEKDDLQALLKNLKAKLDVYLAELKARAAG